MTVFMFCVSCFVRGGSHLFVVSIFVQSAVVLDC